VDNRTRRPGEERSALRNGRSRETATLTGVGVSRDSRSCVCVREREREECETGDVDLDEDLEVGFVIFLLYISSSTSNGLIYPRQSNGRE
jgi:hypothetical protein